MRPRARTRTARDGGVAVASVEALLREASRRLRSRVGADARAEAEILLAHVLGVDRARLLALDAVGDEPAAAFRALVAERADRARPVAYLTGRKGFRDLELLVDERVLVPRPETELVVDVVEELLAEGRVPPGPLVDRGTGSAALALALATRRPVLAIDLSADALVVAALNLARERARAAGDRAAADGDRGRAGDPGVRLHPCQLCRADGLTALRPRSVAVVVANPPYVRAEDFDALPPEVRDHEPALALVPDDGTVAETFARLAREAAAALVPGGWLVTEMGQDQSALVGDALVAAGFEQPALREDLAGIERVASAAVPDGGPAASAPVRRSSRASGARDSARGSHGSPRPRS